MENLDTGDSNDPKTGNPKISYAPLHLGGDDTEEAPQAQTLQQNITNTAGVVVPGERIKGVRTFFTKLHPGAINYLDEQITNWLTENPDISIKRTNVITGEITSKNTEPNIIVTIWY